MIGRSLGHYEILEKLGEGGMGVVYKARDTHLDRFVAIKVLPPDQVADPERKRRFVQEAKAASALNHPDIVTIHDIERQTASTSSRWSSCRAGRSSQLIPARACDSARRWDTRSRSPTRWRRRTRPASFTAI